MLNVLEEKTSDIEGVLIEDNRFCISVHYRHVNAKVIGNDLISSPIFSLRFLTIRS